MTPNPAHAHHKLLIANRGEVAVRILRTAKRLGICTIAVYTRSDATAPHVVLGDEAAALRPDDVDPISNARGYLDADAIVAICKERGATLMHPGYGFLSEDARFAQKVTDAGVTWLGPRPETIEAMGLKHRARDLAREVDVPLVPGSRGLLQDVDGAVAFAEEIGFPVMLKCTAGGGGMGLVVCGSADELRDKFPSIQARAQALFQNDGLFVERYYPAARHIEVQVFGDGVGHAIHMGERECSIQRRHQKVIEEAPSPFMLRRPNLREKMCDAAVRLAKHVEYESAGTVEFLVDDATGAFFFLEMNARLQVEHPVTEQAYPGLDIVELMILQGIARHDSTDGGILSHIFFDQSLYTTTSARHAIEARLYCENPASEFKPCPGVLQQVNFPDAEWLRVDSWVVTGTTITSHFDPLACKLIATGSTRAEAIERLQEALDRTNMYGPPNNVQYLRAVCTSEAFRSGDATTTFLNTFAFVPSAFTVLSAWLETTVQDYPGRRIGLGIPRSGPMDFLAFRTANILVGNDPGTEGLELTLTGCRLLFHTTAVVAVTGASAKVTVDGKEVRMWERIIVPAGAKFVVGTAQRTGMRAYLAVRGGFPEIPKYLGSKSTSMGMGGYQGRALTAGDHVALGECAPAAADASPLAIPESLIPVYPQEWTIHVLPGPQCDPTFITEEGIADFFATRWTVSAASNRMGVRLEGPRIAWTRENGGEGGSHPSNILDNGYAFGTINVNGDTPVILTNEGPDMGGYVCADGLYDRWKLGQLRAGSTIQFQRVSFEEARDLYQAQERFFRGLQVSIEFSSPLPPSLPPFETTDDHIDPRLHEIPHALSTPSSVVFRQAGDSAILVEFGDMELDFAIRARIHAFESEVRKRAIPGVWFLAPCIRSTMVHFDPLVATQDDVLAALIEVEASLPASVESLTFPGRRITFPVVLDDRWNHEALEKYMRNTRDTAAYLPSNIEYLARNNGLSSGEEALRKLVTTDWLVFGVGFYLACPFLVPIDPRCRLVGQKMNPSRTFTPRGAIGIAGLVAAIYPIESPGGYQLFGRTLSPWQTWGKGKDFNTDSPWLLQPFDQVAFEVVNEEDYLQAEAQFDAGRYTFNIEDRTFSMAEYSDFVRNIVDEIKIFKEKQALGVALEDAREKTLFAEWDAQRRKELEVRQSGGPAPVASGLEGAACTTSSLSANIWKIRCTVGDVVKSEDDVLIILEAMKTEVNITAGEENVGRRVAGFGQGVREGSIVQAGAPLVYFE
ncbi:hypothetical protein V8D89_009876 [Ganoderma adspersum]